MDTVAVGERVAGETEESVAGLAYRPYLDGLRAVAVYLVVLFHAGSGRFSGGYIGVDVFFVLSGFLVTQLLLRDLGRTGKIRYGRFYSRRFRRLLPAAFVALIVTAVVYTAIASPAEVVDAVGSFKAAFLYVTNWYFIHQATGYFGADLTTNPVLQFWSLAIEEQFYLLWPLTLGGLFWATRRMNHPRRIRTIQIAVAVAAVASALWALSLRHGNPNRAYYGTDARAYELLAGALLALVPTIINTARQHRRAIRTAAIAALAALIFLATNWTNFDAIVRGIAVTLTTAILLIALEAADGGIIHRLLSHDRLVYLGKVSYGTYLWHWIVIIVIASSFHLSTLSTIAITAAVATALASLSYELLERPIRLSALLDKHRLAVIATGLALSIISALIFIPKLVDPANATTPTLGTPNTINTAGYTPIPPNLDWRTANKGANEGPFPNCFGKPVEQCTVVHGTGKHLLLSGDSHAAMLVPTFTAIAQQEHLTLSIDVRGACPWQRNLYVHPLGNAIGTKKPCQAHRDDLYTRVIPALHPDVIIAMNLAYESPTLGQEPFLGPDGKALGPGPQLQQLVSTTSAASLSDLAAPGRKILLIEPIPIAPTDPVECLSKAKVLEQCAYATSAAPDLVELLYRRFAKQEAGVVSVDLDKVVCPFFPICDPVVNDQIVKSDRTHVTDSFAKSIAPTIDAYLQEIGVLHR